MQTFRQVEFGWGAPSMAEQFPALAAEDAGHFDADNTAIIRLSVRGLITESQKFAAFKKLTKRIETTLRAALKPAA